MGRRWKWIHLRGRRIAQPFKGGSKVPAWGKLVGRECMFVGSRDHEDPDADGFYPSVAEGVRRVVYSLLLEDGVPPGKVMIGGFSQGAAVSLQTALTFPALFAGCIMMSGWLTPRARVLLEGAADTPFPTMPILICHGTLDDTVAFHCAEFAATHIQKVNTKVKFVCLHGMGHSSNVEEVKAVSQFIREHLPRGAEIPANAAGEDPRLAAAKAAALEVATAMATRLSENTPTGAPRELVKCAHPECNYLKHSNPKVSALYCCEKCEGLHQKAPWANAGKRHYKSCERIECPLPKRLRII